MTFSIRGDLNPGATSCLGATASGSNFYLVTSEPKLRKHSISSGPTPSPTMVLLSSASLAGASPAGVTFISPASIAICYHSSSRYDIYDGNTLATTGITTNALITNRAASQQIAGNSSLNLAYATTNSSGRVSLVGLTCCAQVTPPTLSGGLANCIITRPDTNTWLVGTALGTIIELTSSGSTVTCVSLPSSLKVTGVDSLAYYNGIVAATTDVTSELITMAWPSGQVINSIVRDSNGTSGWSPISACFNGHFIIGNSTTAGGALNPITEMFFNSSGQLHIGNSFFNELAAGHEDLGIEPLYQEYAWCLFNSSTDPQCRIYNLTPPSFVAVTTEAANPIGNPVGCRIIRLRDDTDIGGAFVDYDSALGPGLAAPPAGANRNYIELCLYGNIVNGNPPYTAWDVREFQA